MSIKMNPAQTGISVSQTIHGFTVDKIQTIEELHATAYLFTHAKTGARLLHIYNDDPNNLFSVAFRTPVYDNTGVPHIMEHSVLGGSHKFPLKDPFQEMLKGSLQTFLNALTYRDKTVYPVGSQVEKDFFNLVNVYCDSVFHPLLTENTLRQEGWHFDVESLDKPVSLKGIVYNEMKGVFSDFSSHVGRKSMAALMPDTTYAFESGGEPEHITDLTYEAFTAFHRRYYHPSNSYFVLYGNIASEKSLSFLNEQYLSAYSAISPGSDIVPQPLWTEPRAVSFEAPAPAEDDGTATVLASWIFCDSTDPVATLSGTILSHYLLGTESSPLKRALIDSGLGEDLDDMSGFGTEAVQSAFCAGLRKTRPEHAEKILAIILDTLKAEADKGMNGELLEGALRQVEFSLREVTGGTFPYGLRLADRCYNSWIYNGDPFAHLAFGQPLDVIKQEMAAGSDNRYFRNLIRTKLLDNTHRLLATITASSRMGVELEKQTERQAERLSARFRAEDKKRFHDFTIELLRKQSQPAAPEALATLPRLSKSDLPVNESRVPANRSSLGVSGVRFIGHPIFTSDIVYCDLCFDLRGLPDTLLPYLPLYMELLRRAGTKKQSFREMAVRIALSMGGLGTTASCKTKFGTQDDLCLYSFISGRSLRPRANDMLDIFLDLLLNADLTDRKQIRDLLLEERNSLYASIISSGHNMAMLSASSTLSPSRSIEERLMGISQLRFLDNCAKNISTGIDATIEQLTVLHDLMVNRERCTISLTNDAPESMQNGLTAFAEKLPSRPLAPSATLTLPAGIPLIRGIEINSAVNFLARSWRLNAFDPETCGLLFLMSRYLSTGYLWDKVRVEGGAYGGMAMLSAAHTVFSCASYRDPNLAATLRHFQKGLEYVARSVDTAALEQSVIGAIGRIDQPKSPHGRGFGETLDLLSGYTPETRQAFRNAVLHATPEKLQKTAERVLSAEPSCTVILGSSAAFEDAAKEGLNIPREPLLPGSL